MPLIPAALFLMIWTLVATLWPALRSSVIQLLPPAANHIPDLTFLSDPIAVLRVFGQLVFDLQFWGHLSTTVGKAVVAFLIAASLGSALGWFMATRRQGERMLLPTVEAIRSVPPISLLPIFFLIAGVGWQLAIWLALFGSVWPVTIAAFYALKGVDPITIQMGRNLGLNRRQLAKHIQLPLALPGIFTGLRIALPITLILVIVTEMTAGSSWGLGAAADFAKRSFQFADMMAFIFTIAFVGWLLNHLLLSIQKRALFWHSSFQNNEEAK